MGLDKGEGRCFNDFVTVQTLLASMGLGLSRITRFGRKKRVSPLRAEEQKFEEEVKQQFLKLKEKGLSIPIFTL